MKNLEYKIGGVQIDSTFNNFIVEAADEKTVSIYVGFGPGHAGAAQQFGLNPHPYGGYVYMKSIREGECEYFSEDKGGRIVGGGRCSLYDGKLILDRQSGDYGPIPREAAERFLELLLPELQNQGVLKKLGIKIRETMADPVEIPLDKYNPFWRQI
ncbi:MAG TPA: hypothetical protein VJH20_00360 [Candidatus Nanoarchaeia archaeon]|nr:hypothetical protein [Candidatus Nanoarchaeia archaeon]